MRCFNTLVSLDLTGFYSHYRDFIDQVETTGRPFPSPANPGSTSGATSGGVKIRGIEARAGVRPARGLKRHAGGFLCPWRRSAPTAPGCRSSRSTRSSAVAGIGYDARDRRFGGRLMAT